jgi:hypothetical protein
MNAHSKFYGTPERLAKAQGNYVVGDDKQGIQVYHFLDTPLLRLYKRLGVEDKSDAATDQLRREFVALMKYRDHWYYAGLEGKSGAAELDRVQSSKGGLEESEKRAHHVIAYRRAARLLGMWNSHVVEHIACLDRPASQCSAFGIQISSYRFRKMLRAAAAKLAADWKIA